MARLNNAYFSPYEVIATFIMKRAPKSFIAKLDAKLYPREHQLFKIDHNRRHVSAKTIQPTVQMRKESDTYKSIVKGSLFTLAHTFNSLSKTKRPYKTKKHIARDLLKPFFSIGLMLRGLTNIFLSLGSLVLLSLVAIPAMLITLKNETQAKSNIRLHLKFFYLRAFAHFFDGISSMLSGIIQLFTTPFTYLIQLPIRLNTTYDKSSKMMQFQRIEDNAGIKKYMQIIRQLNADSAKQDDDILERDSLIIEQGRKSNTPVEVHWGSSVEDTRRYKYSRLLHYKVLHCMDNGQPTDKLGDIANHNPAHLDDYAMYLDNKI